MTDDNTRRRRWRTRVKHGKSEGFDSCDRPSILTWNRIQIVNLGAHVTWKFDGIHKKTNRTPPLYYVKLCASFQSHRWFQTGVTFRKRSIWVKTGDFLSSVTSKFDGWPWKRIGHIFSATSSFVLHFIAIYQSKMELQSGNAKFGSKSAIFCPVWRWNFMDDLEK